MRVELADGDWIDIADRLNYAQAIRVSRVMGTPDMAGTLVAAVVVRWAIRDVDGDPIEFPERTAEGIALEAIERMPFDTFQQLAIAAAEVYAGEPDPKASAGRSPGSRSARRSASRSSSRTPTSSQTIPDGPGTISDLRRPA